MDNTLTPPDVGPAPDPLDSLVERWWEEHFPGSVAARVTEIWNHAFAAKEELKRRLKEGA
jgi:hypothetical protein